MSKLVIQFRCLCFFVRDPAEKKMHVVTPATCGCENGGGIDQHAAFLVFPKEGGRLDAAGNFTKPGETGKVDFVQMEGWSLTLPSNDKPAVLALQPSTLDLNAVTGGTVGAALVRGPRDSRITSRITLPSGSMTESVEPGFWDFDGKEKIPLARDVTWTIDDLPDAPLTLRRSRFAVGQQPSPDGDEDIVELRPNDRGEFRLEFHHSMAGDFGRPLETRDPNRAAEHFKAFYTLYYQPARTPIPKFVSSPDVGVVGCLNSVGSV